MSGILVGLLWLVFWGVVGAGVIALVIYGIKTFIYDISGKIEQGVWFCYLLLIVIYAIGVFAGGGHSYVPRPF